MYTMQTNSADYKTCIDPEHAHVERRRAQFGEYLLVDLPDGGTYECAFADANGVLTGDEDPQSPLNRAIATAGYESVEAHR